MRPTLIVSSLDDNLLNAVTRMAALLNIIPADTGAGSSPPQIFINFSLMKTLLTTHKKGVTNVQLWTD
jgi:hypothetical protein